MGKPPKSWSNLGFWPMWFFTKNNFFYLKIRNDPSNGYQGSKKWAIITHYTWSWTTLRNLTKTFSKVPLPVGVSADWWVSIFVHCHLLHLHSIQFACNNVVTIPPGLPDITVVLRKTSQRKSFFLKWGDRHSFFMLIFSWCVEVLVSALSSLVVESGWAGLSWHPRNWLPATKT